MKSFRLLSLLFSGSIAYVVVRYLTYLIQFINSLLLAVYLGPFAFGIYSFLLLLLQYYSYLDFGISDALNTEYALNKDKRLYSKLIWDCSWSISITLALILIIFCMLVWVLVPDLFAKYNFGDYGILLILLGACNNINKMYSIFYRLHGKLLMLNLNQLLPSLLIFLLVLIFKKEYLTYHILLTMLAANGLVLVLYSVNLPLIPHLKFDTVIFRRLFTKGINLLMYGISFGLVTVVSTTLVSCFYNVDDMGIYSYANTLCNAVVMAGSAFIFVFYPKLIYKFGHLEANDIYRYLQRFRHTYNVIMDLLIIVSILSIPLISYFISGYDGIISIFSILMIGKILTNSISGYSILLISKSKERVLLLYGFLAVGVTFFVGIFFSILNVPISVLALSVVVATFIYAYLIIKYSFSMLNIRYTQWSIICEIFSSGRYLIVIMVFVYVFLLSNIAVLYCAAILYLFYNRERLKYAIGESYRIILNINNSTGI